MEHAQDVGEVVGPDRVAGAGVDRGPPALRPERRQVALAAGDGEPSGPEHPLVHVALGRLRPEVLHGREVARRGQPRDQATQVHVPVGGVQGQDAVRREFSEVELERLAGEQVDGDRVGAERVEDEQAELAVGLRG